MKKRSSKLVALLLALAMVLGLAMSASAVNRSVPHWDEYQGDGDRWNDDYIYWDPYDDPWYYDPWTETYDPYSDLFWVSLDDSYMSMNVGDESFLVASGYGGYPSYRYSWSTDNSSVVRITRGSNSDTVWLSAVGNGTTRVRCTARDSNGNSDTAYCEVSVYGNRYSVTSVDVSPRDVTLPAYSSHSIDVSVSDSRADYSVTWTSSNTNIATVSGSSTRATITSKGAAGTATITASVRDRVSGTTRTDTCRVTVEVEKNATYNPSTTLTIGSTTRGTAIYDSLRNQYQSVYGTTLPDSATISFGSSTNGNIATRRLGNGTAISANTNYTMSQYRDMYTEPLGSGNFITPYTIKYNNNNLS